MSYRDFTPRWFWVRRDVPGSVWEMAHHHARDEYLVGDRAFLMSSGAFIFGAQIPTHDELQLFYEHQIPGFEPLIVRMKAESGQALAVFSCPLCKIVASPNCFVPQTLTPGIVTRRCPNPECGTALKDRSP